MAFQRHFFLFFVLCSSFLCSSQAYKFNVEWVLKPSENYDHWAGRNRFQVNDVLVFNYKKGSDSVLVVHNETGYKNCNKTNPIKKLDDGDSEFSFDRSGPFYFISGKDQNCNNGQKLIVVVLAVRNYHHYPSVPPALSPVAKPPASPSPAATNPTASPPLAPSPEAYTPKPPASPSPAATHPTASPPLAPSPEAYTPATPPTSTSPSPAPAATPPSLSPSLAPSPEAYTPALPPASPSPAATPEAYTPASTPASPSPAASTPEADTPAYTPAITPSSSSPVATPESSPPSPPEPTTPSPSTGLSAPANSPEGTPSGNETVPAKTAPAPSSAWAINPTNVLVGSATLVLSLALSGTLCAL